MTFRSLAGLPCVLALALATHNVPARAQQLPQLRAPSFDIVEPAFTDRDVSQFETTLDGWLAAPQETATSTASFWDFARGLQTGRLTPAQEAKVMQHLGDVEHAYPGAEDTIDKLRHMVSALTIGKAAPEIVGHDLDGTEFKLSDYRGKVVVLIFSGEWCGICRSQYPYERLLLELYRQWPFALLGVNSDVDRDAAHTAMASRGLSYRSWWDGYLSENTGGPIATAWNVSGWPTIYVIDGQGIIRFVDLREEDLLKAVRQLLNEPANRPAPSARR